ncbi:1-acyl-sn-glycerol-3-phosphate acyltransferase [Acuticoccus sp. I52.16.1]|uniref:lysophospholipid acyltransferase family protein n=1 Tax=Acuticoccus sp. I52.16.1 TaxID=2928472 RepID=UPI001FD34F06|nr:1-acyl-sn-glycerol-3-phosphate acyltransferase [Acuticoccus sp. I52.16.1]UOM33585.1 1-acyl-sn-glycerol-3-phosphate acyltransferase [Acuticoccus sp. I52.16.1]
MSLIRAIFVILGLVLTSLVLIPCQLVAKAFGWKKAMRTLPWWWHRAAIRLMGIRVHVHGAPSPARPLLITANHVSWLDITVIGSLMPLSYIAKSEVAGWPIFGTLAKLQRTVFVERERRAKTGAVAGEIAERMTGGDVMVLFAEGTSSNGTHVLPFKSSLVGGAAKAIEAAKGSATVQPLAINYTHLDGLPIGRFYKTQVAWYGDMEMASHLWWVLRHGVIDVHVAFGEAVPFNGGAERKAMTKRVEETVRRMVGEATAGRLGESEAVEEPH